MIVAAYFESDRNQIQKNRSLLNLLLARATTLGLLEVRMLLHRVKCLCDRNALLLGVCVDSVKCCVVCHCVCACVSAYACVSVSSYVVSPIVLLLIELNQFFYIWYT